MRTTISFCLFLLASAPPLIAEEFGAISGTYGGEVRSWHTIAIASGGKVQASATYGAGFAGMSDLHVQGHPRPSFTTSDVLSIDAMFRGDLAAGAVPVSVEIMHLPEGLSGPIWTSEGAPSPAVISVDSVVVAEPGEAGVFVGSVSAQLCRKANLTAEPDPTDCRSIEARIDTQLMFE